MQACKYLKLKITPKREVFQGEITLEKTLIISAFVSHIVHIQIKFLHHMNILS
jgi:hypothetical protein